MQVGEREVQLFKENGKRNIVRHPANQRKQARVKIALKKSVKARGIVPDVRGVAVLVEPKGDPNDNPFLAAGFGGL